MLKFPLFHKRKKQVNVEISINNGNTIADTCYISPEAIIGRNLPFNIIKEFLNLNTYYICLLTQIQPMMHSITLIVCFF